MEPDNSTSSENTSPDNNLLYGVLAVVFAIVIFIMKPGGCTGSSRSYYKSSRHSWYHSSGTTGSRRKW